MTGQRALSSLESFIVATGEQMSSGMEQDARKLTGEGEEGSPQGWVSPLLSVGMCEP